MLRTYLDPGQALLDDRFPLPLHLPFTHASARAEGLQSRDLRQLCSEGFLRRLVEGVYVATQVPDSLDMRAAALRLVVPEDAVVTDRTAGWLHGANMILGPGDHVVVPPVSAFLNRRGGRLRNDLTSSGQRMLREDDVVEIAGLRVTTPLRTACDLGRLLARDWAFAALDSMLGLGHFDQDDLWEATFRFKGMRGVRQLRAFVPLADPRSESPGESVTRLRWLDLGGAVPRPELQIEVANSWGTSCRLDLGVEALRFAVEYDGEEWHDRNDEQREHDENRRSDLRDHGGWAIHPVTRHEVFGRRRQVDAIIANGVIEARRRLGL